MSRLIKSAMVGENQDLFPQILALYLPDGGCVADVTWGLGNFWGKVRRADIEIIASDKYRKAHLYADFKELPYRDSVFDALVFDPPYTTRMSKTRKANKSHKIHDFNRRFGSKNADSPKSIADVLNLYSSGFKEALRVLKHHGVFIVKCQDETDHFTHARLLRAKTFRVLDLFVLVQKYDPQIVKDKQQHRARKNHSYFIVYQKR